VLSVALAHENVVSAALVKATVRSAVALALDRAAVALSPFVLTLTEGVLRAMFLSKVKIVAVVLLATVLAGTGAAWLTYRVDAGEQSPSDTGGRAAAPAGEAPPASGNEPQRRAEDERALAERRRTEQKVRLDRAMHLLEATEQSFEQKERQWLEDVIDARLKVMELREELDVKERELDVWLRVVDPQADVKLRTLVADRDRVEQELSEVKKLQPKDNGPLLERLSKEVELRDKQVQARLDELENEAAMRRARRNEGLAKLRGLRRELLIAEEKVQAVQRRVEWQREEARRDREEQAQRVRQLRQALDDGDSPVPPASRPAADLDRRLDQVLRELAELRRALQPTKERRPEEP
jgi:hypothetical protein